MKEFKFNHWQIAYREEKEGKFHLIPNPPFGWCADPFLVEYKSHIYLFAEIYLYKSERNGVIGYCEYRNGEFGEWVVTMDKHWHLSYPNVFVHNDNLYMCPESYQREEIAVYRLIEFPDKWRKVKTLIENGMYVDTTFLEMYDATYLFTFEPAFSRYGGKLLLYKFQGERMSQPLCITEDVSKARPGGNLIRNGERIIRVSQNSLNGYGCGLVFNEVDALWPEYKEHELKRIFPKDIPIESRREFLGVHTYNSLGNLEVIDLKYSIYSWKEHMARRHTRKVFVNKYN